MLLSYHHVLIMIFHVETKLSNVLNVGEMNCGSPERVKHEVYHIHPYFIPINIKLCQVYPAALNRWIQYKELNFPMVFLQLRPNDYVNLGKVSKKLLTLYLQIFLPGF